MGVGRGVKWVDGPGRPDYLNGPKRPDYQNKKRMK